MVLSPYDPSRPCTGVSAENTGGFRDGGEATGHGEEEENVEEEDEEEEEEEGEDMEWEECIVLNLPMLPLNGKLTSKEEKNEEKVGKKNYVVVCRARRVATCSSLWSQRGEKRRTAPERGKCRPKRGIRCAHRGKWRDCSHSHC
ncbi:hypothetical protein Naga_100456g2 [Nannochloropsis gaditana]|uniref:Uncharacterized protein n=1 Tax=Nannochloropsis gaditana TaxID=72520 RepID=W7TAJ7_9STRA|nr:hypothetical protein Naga_100456g2 [Nannochloropsis gaditana]